MLDLPACGICGVASGSSSCAWSRITSASQRNNLYLHFVLQAQAWLDGHTAIPMPNTRT